MFLNKIEHYLLIIKWNVTNISHCITWIEQNNTYRFTFLFYMHRIEDNLTKNVHLLQFWFIHGVKNMIVKINVYEKEEKKWKNHCGFTHYWILKREIIHRGVTIAATFEFRSRESFVSHLRQRRHNRAATSQTLLGMYSVIFVADTIHLP